MSCKIIYGNQTFEIEEFKEYLSSNKNLFLQDFISSDQEGFKKFVEQPINKEIKEEDKIIFGHPAIGKTFAKKNNDFIDVDEDYKEEHTMQKVLRNHAKNTGKKEDLKVWEDYITNWWNKVKSDAKKSGKRIFVSNLPILRMFPQDFDKVITISKDEFTKRAKQRNDYKQGETEEWKSSLDEAINKIDKSKVITTTKYLTDLLTQEQPIVEESKKEEDDSNSNITPCSL